MSCWKKQSRQSHKIGAVKEHHLNVIDEYIDDGWSGTNFDRPSFQRMIEDIEAGKSTVL